MKIILESSKINENRLDSCQSKKRVNEKDKERQFIL